MTVQITLQDPDSARALAAMLMALDSEGVLDAYEESVVESVATSCYEQEPALDPDEMDEYIEEIRARMNT